MRKKFTKAENEFWFYEFSLILFFSYFVFRFYAILSIAYAPKSCFYFWWINPYDFWESPIVIFIIIGLALSILLLLQCWVKKPSFKSWRTVVIIVFVLAIADFLGSTYIIWNYSNYEAGYMTKEQFRLKIGMDPYDESPFQTPPLTIFKDKEVQCRELHITSY